MFLFQQAEKTGDGDARSHASKFQKGIKPVFAIVTVIGAIPELTDLANNEDDALCTVVRVDNGAKAFGVNASNGTLRMTIRAHFEKDWPTNKKFGGYWEVRSGKVWTKDEL